MRKKLAFIFISFALLIAFIPTAVAAAADYESESYTARPQAGGSEYEELNEIMPFSNQISLFQTAQATSSNKPIVPDNAYFLIDISSYQDPNLMDYDLISSQIDGVIMRIGFTGWGTGDSYNNDKAFERHYAAFKSRGVPVGGYWYSCADTVEEGIAEANFTLGLIEGKEFDLPIYWDTEDSHHQAKTTRKVLTDTAIAYMDTMKTAGREVGIYAGYNWINTRLDMTRLQAYDYQLWVGRWGFYSPNIDYDYWMWQFTAKGRLEGYNGNLDFNFRAKNGPDKLKKIDQTPPVISGADDVELILGAEFDLKAGVEAKDDYDGVIAFSVSPKTIDTSKPGTYKITYTAVDSTGNKAEHIRTVTVIGAPTTFSDVTFSHWAYEYIEDLYQQGVIKGYGNSGEFRPNEKLTREHAAKMIAIAAGLDFEGKVSGFPDVDSDSEYSPYIAALTEKGAISGFPDGTFRPEESIKRSHVAKIVALAFELKKGTQTVQFPDMPLHDQELCGHIMTLAGNGIVSGYKDSGKFAPDNQVTRAEFSKMVSLSQGVSGAN